jgi:hypothetical protein
MMTLAYSLVALLLAVLVAAIAFPQTMGRRPNGRPWFTRSAYEAVLENPGNFAVVCGLGTNVTICGVVAGAVREHPGRWWLVALIPIFGALLGFLISQALYRLADAQGDE